MKLQEGNVFMVSVCSRGLPVSPLPMMHYDMGTPPPDMTPGWVPPC